MEFQLNSKAEDFSKIETNPVSSYAFFFFFTFLSFWDTHILKTHPTYKVN